MSFGNEELPLFAEFFLFERADELDFVFADHFGSNYTANLRSYFGTGKINQNQKRPEGRLRSGEVKSENFVFICLYVRLALSLR